MIASGSQFNANDSQILRMNRMSNGLGNATRCENASKAEGMQACIVRGGVSDESLRLTLASASSCQSAGLLIRYWI